MTMTVEDLNIPSGITLGDDLLSEADKIDGVGSESTELSSPAPSIFDDDDEDLAGELVVDGIELAFQVFGHERYEISESKRALLEGGIAKLAGKYGQRAPSKLGQYKEEIVVIILTLIVVVGGASQVKKLRAEDELKQLENKGGKHGD
ncbi:hypothetical protein [Vibrio sp. HN007]|uniref:hypothetical protein n=1 Tax=Vibrio iocasae TaxID=3098914 RepID=UPI0035D438EF